MNDTRAANRRGRNGLPAVAGCALWVVTMTGCETMQSTAKEEAQQNWNDQRAALKYELAGAELRQGNVTHALSLAREAISLSPQQPRHGELLARAYIATGDFAAAQRILEMMQELHPEFGGAEYLLGVLFEHHQHWERAIEAYGQAVADEPDNLDYLVALAQVTAQRGDGAKAVEVLHDEARRFDFEPAYHLALAELHRETGDLTEACDAYRKALALGIDEPAARRSLGLCLYWLGRYGEALEMLESFAIDADPPPSAVMSAYAGCLLALNQPEQAADWLGRFTIQSPDEGSLHLLLARAHAALEEYDAAVTAARRATVLMPRLCEARTILAVILLAADRTEDAAREIGIALGLKPDDADATLVHGRILEKQGDRDGAGAAYFAALRADSDNALAAQLLSRYAEASDD